MKDLISRQAAIDAILAVTGNSSVRELYEHVQEHGLSDMWSGGVNAAIDIIIAVPSAQPEIIHCSNCRFFKRNIPCTGGHYNGCEMWLDDGNEIRVMTDDYCSKALPKEGEEDETD